MWSNARDRAVLDQNVRALQGRIFQVENVSAGEDDRKCTARLSLDGCKRRLHWWNPDLLSRAKHKLLEHYRLSFAIKAELSDRPGRTENAKDARNLSSQRFRLQVALPRASVRQRLPRDARAGSPHARCGLGRPHSVQISSLMGRSGPSSERRGPRRTAAGATEGRGHGRSPPRAKRSRLETRPARSVQDFGGDRHLSIAGEPRKRAGKLRSAASSCD